jgi:dATP/dGTP diphosphohydrolase
LSETPGFKMDKGKPRNDLFPVSAEDAISEVLTYGVNKGYPERNWEDGMKWSRVYAALRRHLNRWWRGETIDPESGFNHIKHVLTNAAFLVEYSETHPELDDRPVKPKT